MVVSNGELSAPFSSPQAKNSDQTFMISFIVDTSSNLFSDPPN